MDRGHGRSGPGEEEGYLSELEGEPEPSVQEVPTKETVKESDFKNWRGKKFQRLDDKALAIAQHLLDDGIAVGKKAELLQRMFEWKRTKGFLTEAQRKLIRNVNKDLAEFPYYNELRNRLVLAYNEDRTPKEAQSFIHSVIAQFDEEHSWTQLQLEQIIRLVAQSENDNEGLD